MLQLRSMALYQFKNYAQENFDFDSRVVGITGPNGAGKTNLLDAIYYMGFTKSYFNSRDTANTTYRTQGFRLEGRFQKGTQLQKVSCVYRDNKKTIALNDKPYARFSLHIGTFPAVIIAPDDQILVTGGSELRRKFMDILLCQTDSGYLEELIAHQKILSQRNSLLKAPDAGRSQPALLDVFDQQLATHGQLLFARRQAFVAAFKDKVQFYYNYLSDHQETIALEYDSALFKADLATLLKRNREKDHWLGRTSDGVQRDDLAFIMDDHPLKQVGSQGQKKSFLFALKLAQFEWLREHKGFAPVLLLDDVFEKLDQQRIGRLIALIKAPEFGQVFITDTEAKRLEGIFSQNGINAQMIALPARQKPA